LLLTFSCVLDRCQVTERAVRSKPIVIDPPGFDLGAGILHRQEVRDVQTLIAQSSIERFYVPVLCLLSWVNEVELHAALVRPLLERLGSELCAVIHRDRNRRAGSLNGSIQGRDHVTAGEREPRLKERSLATKLIDQGEHAEWPPIE